MLILVGSHVLALCENKLTIVGNRKVEKQGYYKNAEQADEQGYYQNVEQADEQGYYQNVEQADEQGYYQNADKQGYYQNADEQGYYKNAMTEQKDGPGKYLSSTNMHH